MPWKVSGSVKLRVRVMVSTLIWMAGLWGAVLHAQDNGVGFSESEIWVLEDSGSVVLFVWRFSDDTAPFTVDYRMGISDQPAAEAGADYVDEAGTLRFGEGEMLQLLTIELLNDGVKEPTESFAVTLSNPSDGRSLAPSVAIVRIMDNDPGVGFIVTEAWVMENQSTIGVLVQRGCDLWGPFSVDYATTDGTARAGLDYVATSGTLQFAENEWGKILEIGVINDGQIENEETFAVRLSNPSAGMWLDPPNSVVMVTIMDNDLGVGFVPSWFAAREDVGHVELRVERLTDNPEPFVVAYETQAPDPGTGGATPGVDFVSTAGVLEFGEGENVKTIRIELVNDGIREMSEEFPVWLGNVTGAAIRIFEPRATVVIEDNDPGIHFDPIEVRVLESEPQVVLSVHRGSDGQGAFTVDYLTRAVPGADAADHPMEHGTLEFGAGERNRALVFSLPDDEGVWDGDNEFEVVLTRPTGREVTDTSRHIARVLVIDDDSPLAWETHWVGDAFPEVWGLQAVTWGGGRYVAVGGDWAVVSHDGQQWTAQRVDGFGAWDVIWVDDEYVAVGDYGVWRSTDGLNWNSVPGGTFRNLFRVCHGDGMLVALDRQGQAWMTPDKVQWTSERLGNQLQALAYGEGAFVVVGDDGKAWRWQPGRPWEDLGRIAPGWLGAVTWGDVGFVTTTPQYDEQTQSEYLLVLDSWDGRHWWTNRVDEPISTLNLMAHGDGAYVGVSWNGAVRLRWETNRWVIEGRMAGFEPGTIGDLAYGDAGFVGSSYSTMLVSRDGLVWERLGRFSLSDIQSTGGRLFVEQVRGDGWHGGYFELFSSTDAVEWTAELSGGFWGSPMSAMVAMDGMVGYLRGGSLIMRYRDGKWRTVTLSEQSWLSDLAAGGGHWMVLGRQYDEVAQRERSVLYRSGDGKEWESSVPSLSGELSRVFQAGDWIYATGYEDRAGDVVMQSNDGVEWQRSPLSGAYELYGVTFGKGRYVAAAHQHSKGQKVLLQSANGLNWTITHRMASTDYWSADVQYGSGMFAVSWMGWPGATSLSTDGLNWRRHTPLEGTIEVLDYADGRFVAIGPGGLLLRSPLMIYMGEPQCAADGSIHVLFEGEGGREYAIEASTDLSEWTAIGTVQPMLSAQEITLPAPYAGHRFYRLRAVD